MTSTAKRLDWSLAQQWNLFLQLTRKEIRLATSGRVLGVFWNLLSPVALILIYYLAFTYVLGVSPAANYPLFLALGILHWQFFAGTIQSSTHTILANSPIIATTRFPRYLLPLATVAAQAVLMGYAFIALMLVFRMLHGEYWWGMIAYAPWMLVVSLMLAGAALFFSAATVFLRDLAEIVGIAMRVGFFASPVLFTFERVGSEWHPLLNALPFAAPLTAVRDILYRNTFPALETWVQMLAWAGIALAVGWWAFQRTERSFVEWL